jgi:hypothetical protein
MRHKMMRLVLAVGLALAIISSGIALVGLAHAQTGGGYDLTWSTIEGGGYMFSTGSGYSLGGTMGQPDAGVMSGGGYTLAGGFWGGAVAQYKIYLPLVLRS